MGQSYRETRISMPLEIECACEKCGLQTVTVSHSRDDSIQCPRCGGALLKSRVIEGYLYILSNSSIPGLLKIGLTTRPVEDRVAELNSATGVPAPFTIEAYFESSDPQAHETAVHMRLAAARMPGKEFFRLSLDQAVQAARLVTSREPLGQKQQTQYSGLAELRSLFDRVSNSGENAPEIWGCRHCLTAFFGPSATGQCPRCGYGPVGPI